MLIDVDVKCPIKFYVKHDAYLSQRWMHIEKECSIYVPAGHFAEMRFIPTENVQRPIQYIMKEITYSPLSYS